jgi:hypothetical protein
MVADRLGLGAFVSDGEPATAEACEATAAMPFSVSRASDDHVVPKSASSIWSEAVDREAPDGTRGPG